MFHVSDVVQLASKEQVHALVRVHKAYLWFRLGLAAVFFVIPFFFLFSLLRAGTGGLVAFLALTGFGLLIALHSFFLWDAQVLVLTNHRLVYVIQRNLWHRVVSEVSLETIRDLQWEQATLGERILHSGTVRIKTGAGSVPDLTAARIPEPEGVVRLIKALREERSSHGHGGHTTASSQHELSLDDRRERVHAWVSEAPASAIDALERLMQEHGHSKK